MQLTFYPRLYFASWMMIILMSSAIAANFVPFTSVIGSRGQLLGGDYPQFYILGHMIRQSPKDLYNEQAQIEYLHQIFPEYQGQTYWPIWYPPITALLFIILSQVPYLTSFLLFSTFNFLCVFISLKWLLKTSEQARWPMVLCFGLTPILEALFGGQLSIIALLIASGAAVLIKTNRLILSGIVLSVALFKPNILCLYCLGLIIVWPRILLGLVPSAIFLILISWSLVGSDGLAEYFFRSLTIVTSLSGTQTADYKVMGLSTLIVKLFPGWTRILVSLCGVGIVVFAGIQVKRVISDKKVFCWYLSFLILVNALCNLYTPLYDLSLLLVLVILGTPLLESLFAPRVIENILLLIYIGPYVSQAIASVFRIQLFPLVLLAFVFSSFLIQRKLLAQAASNP
jgi:hypothetical protein